MALTKVSGDILDTGIVVAGVTTSTNFKTGTSNLHNVGIEIAGINVLGADTPIGAGVTIYNSGGADFTGVVTATRFVGQADISGGSITATTGTFSGDVSIGGTLTYQDVTNIDSVGLGTFRNGINVTAGVSTFAAAIDANGGANIAGGLVVNSAKISDLTDNRVVIAGTSGELEDSANLTFNGATLNVNGGSTDTPLIVDTTSANGSHMRFQKDAGNKHFVGSGGGFGLGDIDDLAFRTVDNLIFGVGTSEKVRITSDGYLLVGHNTRDANIAHGTAGRTQLWGTSWANAGIALINTQASTDPAFLSFAKSRKASATASAAAVQSGDRLGEIRFAGDDGTDMHSFGASIAAYAEGTIAGNRMPGKLVFATTSDTAGAVNSSTRLVIDQSGHIIPGDAGTQDLGSPSKEYRHLYLGDSGKIYLGSDQDLEVNHTGTDGYVKTTTGDLWLQSTADDIIARAADNISLQVQGGEYGVEIVGNAGVKLYYDSSTYTGPKFETTATGISVDGEVAAKQDYPDYRPTLDLNFAAVKKLDPRITYYRTGPASYTDEFGKVVLVGDNTPRFDHDPVTRESKGLLIEESRTNVFDHSIPRTSYTSNAWSVSQGSIVENTTETTAPDGTYTATKFIDNSTNNQHLLYQSPSSGISATNYIWSLFVKEPSSNSQRYISLTMHGMGYVAYDIQDGVIAQSYGSGIQGSGIYPVGNGWYRCWVEYLKANTNAAVYIILHNGANGGHTYTGNGTDSLYVWGAQLEQVSTFISSYIPTSYGPATRGTDVVRVEGQEFADFYDTSEWTLLTITDVDPASLVASPSSVNDIGFIGTDGNNYFKIRYVTDSTLDDAYIDAYGTSNSSVQFDFGGSHNEVDTSALRNVKTALAAKLNDSALTYNGNTVEVDTGCALPLNVGTFYIGQNPKQLYVKRIMYYPKRLPNAQLVTLTS